jgi:hypothetical protein
MRLRFAVLLAFLLQSAPAPAFAAPDLAPLRPPAVPLVAHDPYFSVWSMADRLTDGWPRHWTGAVNALCGLVRIDGETYRCLGPDPQAARVLEQKSVEVLPTRTLYVLEGGGVRLALRFMTPALFHDLDVLSRPVTYLTWTAQSIDGKPHQVTLYLDASAEWAVNRAEQEVTWDRESTGDLQALRVGTREQPVLAKKGDNLRIDWGWFYLAASRAQSKATVAGHGVRERFAGGEALPAEDDSRRPRRANDDWPVLAFTFDLGAVGAEPVSRHILIAYDDLASIELMGERLRPYWRRKGMEAKDLLTLAEKERETLETRCRAFDDELLADLRQAGGERYARLAALSYRQCIAAGKLVAGPAGEPLYFSKENFSNGCIATVDVIYPAAPIFLVLNPALLRAQTTPLFAYARGERWKFPFAPHDLGTYPKANGQVYGGGERSEKDQMPVEESGNMILLAAAIARAEGTPAYAREHWDLLAKWAKYLREKGLDPENQLCTDDFAGHLAHNTNLSLKALLALAAYARLAEALDKREEAADYGRAAKEMAGRWMAMADDGDHYRLAFDKPGTWSQKYNLVWDRVLGLDLFPAEVARKELAYYRTRMKEFGLPLDNRSDYTKLDWVLWTATLASSPEEFEALVAPVYEFAHRSPNRVPLTDWYWTHDAKQRGFQARSVVGGVFMPLLARPELWKKWVGRAAPKG